MSDNKQQDVLNGYERLKRRNRRRLVLVSGLALFSGALFAMIWGSSDTQTQASQSKEAVIAQNKTNTAAKAAVLEPIIKEEAASVESVETLPHDAASDVEVLIPEPVLEPQDVGKPVVLINDKLIDSNIDGLKESEEIRKAEAAKLAAEKKRQEERRQYLAEQQAAEKAEQPQARIVKEPVVVKSETTEKKRVQSKQEASAKNTRDTVRRQASSEPSQEKKQKARTAEQKAVKPAKAKVEAKKEVVAKAKTEASSSKADTKNKADTKKQASDSRKSSSDKEQGKSGSKAVEKSNTNKNAAEKGKKESSEKAKTDSSKSAQKAAIQAGYAEKERALSLQRKMKAAGINASVTEITTDKGKVYRVKSGNYKSRQEAERDLNKMRVHGIAGQVVGE